MPPLYTIVPPLGGGCAKKGVCGRRVRTSCEQLQGCGASTGFPRDVSPLHFAALSPRGGGAFPGDVWCMGSALGQVFLYFSMVGECERSAGVL